MKQVNVYPRLYYYYTAAVTTGIAGILHLRLFFNGLDRGINEIGMFFLVSGVIQLFWVIPMVRRWGRPWYYFGLGGTIVLIGMWVITRVPNPITNGRALSINSLSIVTELFEIAFIIITAIIISKERAKTSPEIKQGI
ncbi:MAG TPA: hypothetical protein VFI73_05085 [Candidatus Nitrosopolaris sp.]|nr:hypothetical protein [Candidatus Nitrosopolaris sp.]